MILYAIQWHRMPLPPHEDEADLDWATWPGHDDYWDEAEAYEAAREFDAAFDGAYVHRVVARRADGPSVASTRGAAARPALASAADDAEAALSVATPRARGGAAQRG
jgi:hypothetical protein